MQFTDHISHEFSAELEDIKSEVLAMGGLVEEQLSGAVRAMVEGDTDRATKVAQSDYQVNAMEVRIDEQCSSILARRQPAASDLRLVLSVIKTITDLERIGDEAERVARMAEFMAGESLDAGLLTEIEHMGQLAGHMLNGALDAFARQDADAALELTKYDKKVDRKYESIMRQLITFMAQDPHSIPMALKLLWAARSIERVGDRSQNICEYVIYLVKGRDVRHTNLSQHLASLKENAD